MQVNKFGDPEHFISASPGAILNVIIPATSRELRVIPYHMIIYKQFTFDAAHFLPRVPEGHKCRQLHGHTYHLTVFVSGPVIEPEGWVVDFGDLKGVCKPVIARLDHSLLNELPGLENPTAENVVRWLWQQISKALPGLYKLELKETPTSGAIYKGE